jgi:hypothetical protein
MTTKEPEDTNVVPFDTEDEAREETIFPAVIDLFRALVIYHQ